MGLLIKHQVENRIYEVGAQAFTRGLLYMSGNEANQDRDYDLALAEKCFEALKTRRSDDRVIQDLLKEKDLPTYANGKFPQLRKVSLESELYTPYLKLLNFIATFFSRNISGVDEAWQLAVDPNPAMSRLRSQYTGKALRRDFFDTHDNPPNFSRFHDQHAELKPDICLILNQSEGAAEPLSNFHWKDIKVPIEIKRQEDLDNDTVVQAARHAQAVLMEQFDRKFAFGVTLTQTDCRVFHWDTVGSHVTEAIDIHKDPVLFFWTMGRLATMTPIELGYDDHFSNAGRVLSYQALTTTLTIHESKVRQFFDHRPPPPGVESNPSECPSDPPPLVLELDTSDFLFESRDVLFNRATRVWQGFVVENTNPWTTGASRVVKQNWADDARPNEGYFYQLAKGIPGIVQISRMEECDYTSDYHTRVDDKDVIGLLDAIKASREETQDAANTAECYLERVLLRFVFEQGGRPLNKARNGVEVLEAVVQWVEALIALDKVGIVHRDISFGNLLPKLDGSVEGGQAKIIDLGLAHLKPKSGDEQLSEKPREALQCPATTGEEKTPDIFRSEQAHHHVTGTLPFIACELLEQLRANVSSEGRIPHGLHYDVESIFWVVLYLCMRFGGDTVQPWALRAVATLCSLDIDAVASQKDSIMRRFPKLLHIGGDFASLGPFLEEFARYIEKRDDINQPIDALKVRDLAVKHRDILKQVGVDDAVILPSAQPRGPPKSLENSRGSSLKRTYSVRESEWRMSNVEDEVRLQNEDEGLETPSKKRRLNEAGPLEFSTSNRNLV
ncbi:hypothetical protein FRC04_010041 [Tulasnella sp. 424]|nr:hypothetical protein FRC04_010041 [Tulasnella sp. 424]